jgi:mannosyltransferase OCH1-like enzyme
VIPRTIHHIWIGPDPLPGELAPYVESWRRHHPGWELRFWGEDNLPEDPIRPEIRERLRSPVERSDILRLEILYRYGGVYVDTDLECLRPLDDVLGDADFVATTFKPGRVTNTFIASAPEHPLLAQALGEIKPREFHGFDKEVAGPPFLARLVSEHRDIALLEPHVLFPGTPEEQQRAVAIHHMSRTWKDADGLRQSMLRAEERLEQTKAKLEKERERHADTRKKLEALEARRRGKQAHDRDGEVGDPDRPRSTLRSKLGF